ncbi:hypothetical protein TrVE_jg4905 [Triparma verrucosa]|uniref:Uncharacterized protein n=1 Tax=Triparma verrucosa TaxID=1606542 RepID=A0A9W7BVD7_9STRA|nr:hypothetical protein TrVE_jg4905 [Triparma verrucosa]
MSSSSLRRPTGSSQIKRPLGSRSALKRPTGVAENLDISNEVYEGGRLSNANMTNKQSNWFVRLFEGVGNSYEMVNIFVSFLQIMSLISFLPAPWPISFDWYQWFTVLMQVQFADLVFLEERLQDLAEATGDNIGDQLVTTLAKEWYKTPTILLGLLCLPVLIFNWDTGFFVRTKADNHVQYAVKNHSIWMAKKKLLIKEFLPGILVFCVGMVIVNFVDYFGNDGKEGDNTLPPIIAALGSVPYTISAVFKAFSMRVDRSTRRARRTAQSKCQQATNFFGWLVRLVIPIAPLLAYASKHMIKSWASVMNEDLADAFEESIVKEHAYYILPACTFFMLSVKLIRQNPKKMVDDMGRKTTAPFKTVLMLSWALSFSCLVTNCFMVLNDAATPLYWAGMTHCMLGFLWFLYHILNFIHWWYLHKMSNQCRIVNMNFQNKRRQFESTVFLFSFSVFYLTGVHASLSICQINDDGTKIFGYIMLVVYTLVTGARLYSHTKTVHLIVQETALRLPDGDADDLPPYYRAMTVIKKQANADLNGFVEIPDDERHWTFDPDDTDVKKSSILQASVITIMLEGYIEKFWYYKFYTLLERTAVACVVLSVATLYDKDSPIRDESGEEVRDHYGEIQYEPLSNTECDGSSISTDFEEYGLNADHACWAVVCLVLIGFFASLIFSPYWNSTENFVDIISRATCCVIATFAAILTSCIIDEKTPWVIVTINVSGAISLFVMIFSIGPVRITREIHHYVQAQKRSRRFHIGPKAIKEMQDSHLEGITDKEFFSQSLEIQMLLVRQFPHYKPFLNWLQAGVEIDTSELTVLQHCAFVMKQDIAWMYCTEHGSVTGVESVNGEVTKINWAGAGLQGEVPLQLSKLKKLRSVDLRFNALTGGDMVRSACGIDAKSFLMDNDVEKVAIADCALAVGKDMNWLLQGAKIPRKWPFRGVTVDPHGKKVTAINWSLSRLKGRLPLALDKLKYLGEVNFSGNVMETELPLELQALSNRIGDKMKWGPAVTYLGTERQFYNRDDVLEVNIPKSFRDISLYAFRGCVNMKKLNFEPGSKLKAIKEGAFHDCRNLDEIKLPEGLEEIAESGFYNCGVSRIELPDDVKEIGDRAFYGCRNLTDVKVPKGLKKIGKFAFADCPLLETIRLKKGVVLEETSFAAVTNCDIIWYDDDNRMYRIDDGGGVTEISDENDLLGDFFGSASGNV